MRLLEFRPGRYCWLDDDGKVIRKATEAEVRAERERLAGRASAPAPSLDGLPLFTAATEATIQGEAKRKPDPARTPKPEPAPTPPPRPAQARAQSPAPTPTARSETAPKAAPSPIRRSKPPGETPRQIDSKPATRAAPLERATPRARAQAASATAAAAPRSRTASRQFDAQVTIPQAPVQDRARPKPAPRPKKQSRPEPPKAPAPAPEPEPAPPREALDTANLKAGDLVCSNCGQSWPGTFSGFWRQNNGQWFHWCHGGRPGAWRVAELAEKKRS